MMRRLVRACPLVITGYGAFSAAGTDPASLWQSVVSGISSARWEEASPGMRSSRIAVCRAPEIPPSNGLLARTDRSVRMAYMAARQALESAGLDVGRENLGLIVGSSRGSLGRIAQGVERLGRARMTPSLAMDGTFASLGGNLANLLGIADCEAMVSATCASGAYAVAQAAQKLLLGETEIMLVGATEAALHPLIMAQMEAASTFGFHQEAYLTCRAFSAERNGLIMGEGAGFLVLETAAGAQNREAKILARLSGWSTGRSPAARASIHSDGSFLQTVAGNALKLADIPAGEIDYVNAHGTGTVLNDLAEACAIKSLLGNQVPVSATKAATGHCLGATPILEAIICIEALRHGVIPHTLGCAQPDRALDINVITGAAKAADLRNVMSNSLGFWGYTASLIFSQP